MNDKEMTLIPKISKRAESLMGYSKTTVAMDLSACMMGGNKLDLEKLLSFDDTNFSHDIQGINANLNHGTYQIENQFMPRCAG